MATHVRSCTKDRIMHKILVVDDVSANRLVLKQLLERYGVVDMATDGQHALSKFLSAHTIGTPYTIIFMDINMPELDGHECVSTIRKYEGDNNVVPVSVVMVTAFDSVKNSTKSFYENLCIDYLVKPVDKNSVAKTMNSIGA